MSSVDLPVELSPEHIIYASPSFLAIFQAMMYVILSNLNLYLEIPNMNSSVSLISNILKNAVPSLPSALPGRGTPIS